MAFNSKKSGRGIMSKVDDLAWLDATEQADLIRRKEVQSIELVEAAIERIERINPELNAVITSMYDLAREAAQGEIPDGPFSGVPFLLKDIGAMYAGVRMAYGTRVMKDFVPDHDSELVVRQKKAGLITLGKTNTPELGLVNTTEPELFGPTRNPWNTERTTGGSSGGAVAAVASGMVSMAHANDGGGSIRIPAACCGLFGLKPTRARNPLGPDYGEMLGGLVCEHVVTRSVRDSAAMLDATAGPDVGDPYWAPPSVRPFIEEVGADPGRLRIAFRTEEDGGIPVHPDCAAAVRESAKLCEELGHNVFEIPPLAISDPNMVLWAFNIVWKGGLASTIEGISMATGKPPKKEDYEILTWAMYEEGKTFLASQLFLARQILEQVAREIARAFLEFDVMLGPIMAQPPVPLGTIVSTPEEPMKGWAEAARFAPFCAVFNMTGQPAASIPLFWNDEGLPIGTQFTGRFGDEATLFRLAAQLEQARPWTDRRPPVSA
jgi:amidase